jgi:hypothetical protein
MAIETGRPTEELSSWDDDDLDVDYFEDDELPGRPLRKRMGPVSIGLVAITFAAGAFFAGVQVEKHNVTASSGTSSLQSLVNRFRGARGAGGAGATGGTGGAGANGGAGGGGATTGTITLVDGSNIYVTLPGGSIVKVLTNPATTYAVTNSGTISNLHPGDNVIVAGPTDSSGNQTATAVQDTGGSGAGGVTVRGSGAGTGGGGGGGAVVAPGG